MENDNDTNKPKKSQEGTPSTDTTDQGYGTPLNLDKEQVVPPQPAGAPQSTQNGYSAPPAPQAPPSAYNATQGQECVQDAYSGAPSQPYAAPQSGAQQGYATPQYPSPGYTYAPRPKDMTVAYAWVYFLGLFGAHKFYMGQGMQGGIYLGITLASFVLSFLGIGFLITVFMLFMMYADIRTMPEQIARSNNGEQFSNLFEFLKKAFR